MSHDVMTYGVGDWVRFVTYGGTYITTGTILRIGHYVHVVWTGRELIKCYRGAGAFQSCTLADRLAIEADESYQQPPNRICESDDCVNIIYDGSAVYCSNYCAMADA